MLISAVKLVVNMVAGSFFFFYFPSLHVNQELL